MSLGMKVTTPDETQVDDSTEVGSIHMQRWTWLVSHLRAKPVEIAAIIISCIALFLSIGVFVRVPAQHSDVLTSSMIRETYSEFLDFMDRRAQYPLQSHLFALPDTYSIVKAQVIQAMDANDISTPLLQERAVAQRQFIMFEHAFYQWTQARNRGDATRAQFLKEVLDYFTGRLLRNPRLVWYWSPEGGNLGSHCESSTIDYYNKTVKPYCQAFDNDGPFVDAAASK